MRKKRELQGINAGSMADIGFLLLIFFLVATTIANDKSIEVLLPEYYDGPVGKAPDKHVLNIKVNGNDEVMVEGNLAQLDDISELVLDFVTNPSKRPDFPTEPKKAIISIQNDIETSYEAYTKLYSQVRNAYREMRNVYALAQFGESYELLPNTEKNVVIAHYPLQVSEAEPTKY